MAPTTAIAAQCETFSQQKPVHFGSSVELRLGLAEPAVQPKLKHVLHRDTVPYVMQYLKRLKKEWLF